MLGRSTARSFFGGLFAPTPTEPVNPSATVPEPRTSTSEEAMKFIEIVNNTRVYVDATFLSLFRRDVISHAVNLAKLAKREGYKFTDSNQFRNKGKYMSIIDFLKETP
jgi:hypothetical protein